MSEVNSGLYGSGELTLRLNADAAWPDGSTIRKWCECPPVTTIKINKWKLMMSIQNLPVSGSCLCGSVRVRVNKQPLLTLACHCRDCQKLSASAFSLGAIFPSNGFSVSGELVTGGLQTGKREHHFCAKFLNLIFTRIKGAEERVNLRVSVFDDLTWFEPFVELMTDEKLKWSRVPATHSLSRFPESKEQLEALIEDYLKH